MFEESPAEAWKARYGEDAGVLPDLARFLNHRSVRRFSPADVPESMIAGLIAAGQSAATSSNLQMWSVISVQDPLRRKQIAHLCADQNQVIAAPWFLAFIADHHRIRHAGERVGEACLGLDYNEYFTMAVIDAAIAAERMVCAAEHLGVGICYIGALRNHVDSVKEFFELPTGCVPVFGLCIGYPHEQAKADIKPKLRQEAVWFKETYKPEVDVEEYDERMSEFYVSQGMKGDVTWSMRSSRRVDESHLTGRERLKGFLGVQGMDQR